MPTKPDPKLDDLLSGRTLDVEPVLRWLLEASPEDTVDAEAPRTSRLRRLHGALAERGLIGSLTMAWNHASAIRLLAETGLPDQTTLLGEGFQRIVDRFVPHLDAEGDLYALLNRVDLGEADAAWVEGLPEDLRETWGRLLMPPPEAWAHAARLLAYRTSALGLSRDLLALEPEGSDADSPYFNLPRVVEAACTAPEDAAAGEAWDATRAACRATLERAHACLERKGTSTNLVFRLELLEAGLNRMDTLLAFLAGRGLGVAFAAELVRGSATQRSLRSILHSTVKRLARKMVEHTGDTGEHYIARNRREWRMMGWSAAGGGFLTAGTALLKYGISALPLAPIGYGLAIALNYSFSFILMQLLGFSLASKQPAMTAAALARSLESGEHQDREVELVAAISRSQFIAAVGNVCVAVPTALAIGLFWIWSTGHGPLGKATAAHSLEGTLTLGRGTIIFAAFTGVLLWMSSLAAGWAANWSAFRGLPEAIARSHRLRSWVGAARAGKVGAFMQRHFPGIVGYLALGGLLAFGPLVFVSVGIHLEVRHVTLQSAAFALSCASLWAQGALPWGLVLRGLLGIAVIALLNFAVSFGLSLWTALRARDLSGHASRRLWLSLLKAVLRNPQYFLFPSDRPGEPSQGGSHS